MTAAAPGVAPQDGVRGPAGGGSAIVLRSRVRRGQQAPAPTNPLPMRNPLPAIVAIVLGVGLVVLPRTDPHRVVSRDEHVVPARVGGAGGRVTRVAVPAFVAASDDPELASVAAEITDVFCADIEFEGVFDLMPREAEPTPASQTPPTLPPIPGIPPDAAPPANWRQLGADAVTTGAVRRAGDAVIVEIRLFDAASGELAWGRGYSGPLSNPRLVAHVVADEFVQAQAGLRGVFLSRLAFVSDRGGMRRELGGAMRRFKEVWVADYDGAGQRPITTDRDLDLTPNWSPEGDRIAFTSFRRGFQEIAVVPLNGASVESPTRGLGKSWLPAWSPDGSRLAFTSNRDGNAEIYVVNRDGTDLRRLTRHWGIDTSPAWSPSGGEIAFTSDRTGSPQIWIMAADGTNARALTSEKYCDRPAWAPPPHDEVAYVSRTKTGFDIKVKSVVTGEERQLTHGEGFNESPAWSPNGRHIAFSSTRHGGQQIWMMTRNGENLRQVTSVGNNTMPAWSRPPLPRRR